MRIDTCYLDDLSYTFQVCDNCLDDIGLPFYVYKFDNFTEHYCANCKNDCDYNYDMEVLNG